MKPLCIDLFCGLGGWAEGFLAEGYQVIGFDVERHEYWAPDLAANGDGSKHTRPVEKRGWTQGCAVSLGLEGATKLPRTRLLKYPGQLVLQDVLTLHGSQFRNAAVIVASPPCQAYSYRAMPWKQAKALTPEEVGRPKPAWWDLPEYRKNSKQPCMNLQDMAEWNIWREKWPKPAPSTDLFDTCFRIQQAASEAAGRYIPLVVENVKGAQPWVGRARWHYGSFYLWGDVPALMPTTLKLKVPGFRFDGSGRSFQTASVNATKNNGGSWFKVAHNAESGCGQNPDGRRIIPPPYGVKNGNDWFGSEDCSAQRKCGSKSSARKQASAEIAKIPFDLANHIARVYKPVAS